MLELDGLRGIGIIAVVLGHFIAGVPHETPFPWLTALLSILALNHGAIDVFFVLSGFLIGGILLRQRNSPRFLSTFYTRRFYRIVPVYYVWLVVFFLVRFIAVRLYHAPASLFRTDCPPPLYFLFVQNWFPFRNAFAGRWLWPMWTLGVEEQFYLTVPLLIRFLPVRRLTQLLAAVVLFAPCFRFALFAAYGSTPFAALAAYTWTASRADALALGVLAAILSSSPGGRDWIRRHLQQIYGTLTIMTILVLLQFFSLIDFRSMEGMTLGRSTLGLFSVCLVLVVAYHPQGKLAAVCRWGWLRKVGMISYSIYLLHGGIALVCYFLILNNAPLQWSSWQTIATSLFSVGITVTLASLSWRYFEGPLLRRGQSYRY